MTDRRVGLWLVGAFGGVGTTIALGLTAMARGLVNRTGLVSELPLFEGLELAEPGQFVIGGHDIRQTSYAESAEEFRISSGVFDREWIRECSDELAAATARVRLGTPFGSGRTIARLMSWGEAPLPGTARHAVDRIASDLVAFAESESIDHLIVLNVASTEPPFKLGDVHRRWDSLNAAVADGGPDLLPASAIYAIAALRCGYTYINFTPSLGCSLPAAYELAESTGALHAGKDGKTGETLLKTVLAPMFAAQHADYELGRPQYFR